MTRRWWIKWMLTTAVFLLLVAWPISLGLHAGVKAGPFAAQLRNGAVHLLVPGGAPVTDTNAAPPFVDVYLIDVTGVPLVLPSKETARWMAAAQHHRIPLWLAILLLLVPTIGFWRADRGYASWQCVACGYDLTGNQTGICPECGHAISKGEDT